MQELFYILYIAHGIKTIKSQEPKIVSGISPDLCSASLKSTCIQWSANAAQLMATVVSINKNRWNNERFLLPFSDTT